jgi:TonB family protein
VTLEAGTEIIAAPGGPRWALLARAGRYRAEHVGDGLVKLVDLPGLRYESWEADPRVFLVRTAQVGNAPAPQVQLSPAPQTGPRDVPFFDPKSMTRPERISGDDPGYPDAGVEDAVDPRAIVRCVIGADGSLSDIVIVKHLPNTDELILATMPKWRFRPALYQGKPVSVRYTFIFLFKRDE